VRGAALGALCRDGGRARARAAWTHAAGDPVGAIRRRAAELAPTLDPAPVVGLLALLADPDPLVAETAAWALGEVRWPERTRARVVGALAAAATGHADPLVRESAVAALGAIGDVRGLTAILHACGDRPPIRRRAVLALAPFAGPEVDAALAAARTDADWQVRQAAEDLMS
jgi:HEAT repeat protein